MMYKYSTDREIEKNLPKWENLSLQGFELVHTVSKDKFMKSELSKKKAEKVFGGWDVISTSLIRQDDITKQREHYKAQPGPGAWGPVHTHMFYEVGFVLDVPPQNILGTHCKDVWFPNHIGADRKKNCRGFFRKGYQLADRIFSGIDKQGRHMAPKGYNVIKPPKKIWENTSERHNEILLVGREGISMHFKPTRKIKVKEIIFAPKYHISAKYMEIQARREANFLRMLEGLNPGVGVYML